jgi:hypothetical protein
MLRVASPRSSLPFRLVRFTPALALCALASALACVLAAPPACAGANAGASAYLLWSAVDTTRTNLTTPGAANNLYVYVKRPGGLSFKGGEIDLIWNPPGDPDAGCYAHTNTVFKTSAGTTCTYLNRGTVVPVVTADEPGHYHVAWANSSVLTSCTAGAIVQIEFAFDGCADAAGCFTLTAVTLLDASSFQDVATVVGVRATVLGGTSFCDASNHPPVFNPLPDQVVETEHTLTFTLSATDADGDPLTYSSDNLPEGATLSSSGYFVWTPSRQQAGEYDVIFVVRDPHGGSDSDTVHISVTPPPNAAPVFAPVDPQFVYEQHTLEFSVYASDPNYDPLSYTALALPPGATFVAQLFSWTPAVGQSGSYEAVFRVEDPFGASDTLVVPITVTPNHAPVLSPIGDRTAIELHLLTISLRASDPEGDSLTYAATPLPPGATLQDSTFRWTPSTGQEGTYEVLFSAADPYGAADSERVTLTVVPNHPPVLDSIPPQIDSVGTTLTVVIRAEEPDADSVTYSARRMPPGATFEGQTFTWTPLIGQQGEYTVFFTAADPYGAFDVARVSITVILGPDHPPVLAPIGPQVVRVDSLLTFSVMATDSDGDPLTYAAAPLPAGATFVGQTFRWTPADSQAHAYTVVFSVSDGRGGVDAESVLITVQGPDTLYVDSSSPCTTCDGQTWGTAMHTVDEGVGRLRSGWNDVLLLAEGVYETAAQLTPPGNTTLRGGYPHGGGARDLRLYRTIVRELSPGTVVLSLVQPDITVEGIGFTGVREGLYGAVLVTGGQDTLRDLWISQNAITSSPSLVEAVLYIYGVARDVLLERCVVTRNTLRTPNGVTSGGGIYVERSWVDIEDCDIVANSLSGAGRTGITVNLATVTIRNTILWALRPLSAPVIAVPPGGTAEITYCDIQGGWPGTSNLNVNPQFCTLAESNLSLRSSSPLVGAGYNGTTIGAFDVGCAGALAAPASLDTSEEPAATAPPVRTTLASVTPSVATRAVTVRYALASAERAALDVFAATGRLVRRLEALETATSGEHVVRWDLHDAAGRRVPAGVYLVKLRTATVTEERRVLVVR